MYKFFSIFSQARILFFEEQKKNIINNFKYIYFEYFFRFIVNFTVGIYFARMLGPELYGEYTLVISTVFIFQMLSTWGLNNYILKNFIENKDPKIINTFALVYFINIIFLYTVYLILKQNFFVSNNFYTIVSFTILFCLYEIIDVYFQSIDKIRLGSIIRLISLTIISFLKIIFLLFSFDFIFFFYLYLFQFAFTFFLYVIFLFNNYMHKFSFNFDFTLISKALNESWPLILIFIFSIFNQRISIFITNHFYSAYEIGILGAAIFIYEAWTGLIYTTMLVLLPNLIKSKNLGSLLKKLKLISIIFIFITIFILIFLFFAGDLIIDITFGIKYSPLKTILFVYFLGSIFTIFMSISMRYFLIINKNLKMLFRILIFFLFNSLLLIILVKKYSIIGAPLSLLISSFIAFYLFDYFSKDKKLLNLKNESLLLKL